MPPTAPDSPDSLVESIPDPEAVRGAIRSSVRQTALLRRLLLVAETRRDLARPVESSPAEATPHE